MQLHTYGIIPLNCSSLTPDIGKTLFQYNGNFRVRGKTFATNSQNQVRMSKQVRIPEAFTPDTGKNFFLHNGHFRFWGKTFAKVCTKNQVRMSNKLESQKHVRTRVRAHLSCTQNPSSPTGHFRFWGKTFAKVCTKNKVRMS